MSAVGSWVVFCEPEASTQERPLDMTVDFRGLPRSPVRLTLGVAGGRLPVDELLRFDPVGRHLVLREGPVTILRDTQRDRAFDLAALNPDLERDGLREHRSFAFSESGRWLALLTRKGEEQGAVLLDLELDDPIGSARPVDLQGNRVWRVRADGEVFAFLTLREGGAFPASGRERPVHRCAHRGYDGYPRISGPGRDRDVDALVLLPEDLSSHRPLATRPAPGFLMGFGNGWVRRSDEGRLLLVSGTSQKQIASSRCGARILHADVGTGLFLASCEEYRPSPDPELERRKKKAKPKYRFDLYLLRPGLVRDLDRDMMRTGVDVGPSSRTTLIPLRPGAEPALVDFQKKRLIPLESGEAVLATSARGALLRRGSELFLFDGAARRPLPHKAPPLTPLMPRGSVVAVGRTVFQLTDASIVSWELPAPPLALTDRGMALIPREAEASSRWARGPLTQVFAPGADEHSGVTACASPQLVTQLRQASMERASQLGSGFGVVGPDGGTSGCAMASLGSSPVRESSQATIAFTSD